MLPSSPVQGYFGVDREPFLPTLLESELDPTAPVIEGASGIWEFYRPGWRKDAYRLYEENLAIEQSGTEPFLLSNIDSAKEIARIISPFVGQYDVVHCGIWTIDDHPRTYPVTSQQFLGFDAAYCGGDFFSAVRAGLFGSPWFKGRPNEELLSEFRAMLNEYGLFKQPEDLTRYVRRFVELTSSEVRSKFFLWLLNRAFILKEGC